MRISEVAKRAELTKKAVLYYCEQGLLFPKILENGYRSFSEADVIRLQTIGLYRKLGLSVAEIKSRVFETNHSGKETSSPKIRRNDPALGRAR